MKIPARITITLGVLSLISSRLIFFFIDDPEGPNLLIVSVLAAGIFTLLMLIYHLLRWSKK